MEINNKQTVWGAMIESFHARQARTSQDRSDVASLQLQASQDRVTLSEAARKLSNEENDFFHSVGLMTLEEAQAKLSRDIDKGTLTVSCWDNYPRPP
ncbi:MAG: hypothetical protein LBQ75_04660 [Zoogloeaceae bacterium]|nr:hypothetical protein [Zoogloeaceae bacterium]